MSEINENRRIKKAPVPFEKARFIRLAASLIRERSIWRAGNCRTAFLAVLLAMGVSFWGRPSLTSGQVGSDAPMGVSNDGLWIEVDEASILQVQQPYPRRRPESFRSFQLDMDGLKATLIPAPMEFTAAAKQAILVMTVPMPDGTHQRFRIEESPILSAELAAKHPELKTYVGQGIDDPTAILRADTTPAGFHAMVLSADGTVYVDPYQVGDVGNYISYYRRDALPVDRDFQCTVTGWEEQRFLPVGDVFLAPSGNTLRTYRLAISATGEYTTWAGGVAAAQAQITTTINRVTSIYEREVAIRLNIVAFNIYANATTPQVCVGGTNDGDPCASDTDCPGGSCFGDPFDGTDNYGQNQTALDDPNILGSANYDIGHLFLQGGVCVGGTNDGLSCTSDADCPGGGSCLGSAGAVAGGARVCMAGLKARGYTGMVNPQGDFFDVDYVAHEMGHQFDGAHTFNSLSGSCGNAGQRIAASAYEPGSGTTIIAYAGICAPENVQDVGDSNTCVNAPCGASDDYFHTHTFDQITAYREGGGDCGVQTNTGNTPPTVNAGPDYTIPRETPFILTATGNDADGDALTYCWEQYDLGAASPPTDPLGPLFRSRPPTTDPSRTFPQLADILSGVATPWELLPDVDRTMNFRCTVRDNRANGGGVNYDAMVITVQGAPFEVLSPNGGETLASDCTTTVTWDVGGGSVAPTVNILVSFDGGQTFTSLVADTPNDGSQTVVVPCTETDTGRIKIEAVGNVFFDISDADFTIVSIDPTVNCPTESTVECDGAGNIAELNAWLASASASDDCELMSLINDFAGLSDDCGATGSASVTWTATDDCGNTDTCSSTFTIVDTTGPDLSVPADITIECDESADPSNTGTATATDVCAPDPAVTYSDTETPGDCPQAKTITRTWTATDACEQSTSQDQIITVVDTTQPEIICPPNRTILADDHWEAPVPDLCALATITDNCDPVPSCTQNPSAGATISGGDTMVTLTAMDCVGNTSTCTVTITVIVPVDLDIKPGSCPNPLNTNTRSKGRLPVAILGTDLLDVNEIAINSITIAGTVLPIRTPVVEDVGTPFDGAECECHELEGDGINDLVIHFSRREIILTLGLNTMERKTVVPLTVKGRLSDETPFTAIDCVKLVGRKD
ncbi:MAG: M12 family metallo-peptidase [Planctomycetota bacterium]